MRRRPFAWFAVLLSCLVLGACSKEVLYTGLTENEANELIAVLYSADLDALKALDTGGLFRVDVDQDDFADAVALLQSHGLPRERFESLGEVFVKDGFVSSPLEERARLNFALSQEISKTISNIDGVIMARVHLAVPQQEYLNAPAEPSSASVFVKHRPDVNLSDSVGTIKAMVVTGFENLPYENVTVGLFPAETIAQRVQGQGGDVALASMRRGGGVDIVTVVMVLLGLGLLVAAGVLFYRVRVARVAEKEPRGV